jgi:outer membrane biogenesis lipoprotein LolB
LIVRAKRRAAYALSLILRAYVWSSMMKTLLMVTALLAVPLMTACTHEVAHEESTHKNIFGKTTHEETSVQKNDATGDVKTEQEKVRY